MPILMRVTDALRTEGASAPQVHGFDSHTLFRLCFLLLLRNSVAPNSFTSYFVLRTSYLITPVSSRRKAIAHHEARIFLGTAAVRDA